MTNLQVKFPTDTWVSATWDEYLQTIKNPIYAKAKSYYFQGKFRIEMSPVGYDHASAHSLISAVIGIFCSLKNIDNKGLTNCSYRKIGFQEVQPDISYHIGDNANIIPWGTSIVDLGTYPPPDLVIEIANTSLSDDKGEKRLIYEDLKVKEYWIVDVKNVDIIAFTMVDGGSKRIRESLVLPGLVIDVLKEALKQSRNINQNQVISSLLSKFKAS
ncbi:MULTISPECIES: Uma2 family endonuclease [unclassified Okeania]|uniref:Uma2 family endonuclease n=1 Tax=unclassified Okeania TaxID=2634635 RepID=UPI0013BE893C|nr:MULTISPECIES: Uma2 family endonuclease [unclassified Okeania]NES77384.1 Uma2 family endonuclease [Okeania sp. SIO1H4]NET20997.1 Uma2 family endonuclease [Okeania sp. SIO1H5]NET77174.1 Uma2 family endonuclease [Okeania sp. SIO1F9]NET94225.1 Uma2 family endonuclease [Okeania sp. SIO1H2]